MRDNLSGEQVTYTYDQLNRLQTARTNDAWGLNFTYDGFGNLTDQTRVQGTTAPTMSVTINAATNHIATAGYAYDENGNVTCRAVGVDLDHDPEEEAAELAALPVAAPLQSDVSVNQPPLPPADRPASRTGQPAQFALPDATWRTVTEALVFTGYAKAAAEEMALRAWEKRCEKGTPPSEAEMLTHMLGGRVEEVTPREMRRCAAQSFRNLKGEKTGRRDPESKRPASPDERKE